MSRCQLRVTDVQRTVFQYFAFLQLPDVAVVVLLAMLSVLNKKKGILNITHAFFVCMCERVTEEQGKELLRLKMECMFFQMISSHKWQPLALSKRAITYRSWMGM